MKKPAPKKTRPPRSGAVPPAAPAHPGIIDPPAETIPLAVSAIDFGPLLSQTIAELFQDGLASMPDSAGAGPLYAGALEAAIRQNDRGFLLWLLRAGVAVPRNLLPILAQALSTAARGTRGGNTHKLLTSDEDLLRALYDLRTLSLGFTKEAAREDLAEEFGISPSTVKRIVLKPRRSDERPLALWPATEPE